MNRSKSTKIQIASVPLADDATSTNPTIEIKKLEEKTSRQLTSMTKDFNNRITERETRTTEILAIFITLFTFISVNVTIFSKVNDLMTGVTFMILMTLCSTFLLSFTLMIVNHALPNRITSWGLILSLAGLTLIIFLATSGKWNPILNVR